MPAYWMTEKKYHLQVRHKAFEQLLYLFPNLSFRSMNLVVKAEVHILVWVMVERSFRFNYPYSRLLMSIQKA